jgi:hypothetical protein
MEAGLGIDVGIDLVTKADLQDELKKFRHDLSEPYKQRLSGVGNSAISPASGPFNLRVYDVPDGKTLLVTRFIVWGDLHTPGSGAGGVYSAAGAWGGIFHGNQSPVNLADFWPDPSGSSAVVLPYTRDYGWDNALEFRQVDNVTLQITVPPANENITCLLYGWLVDLDLLSEQRKRTAMKHEPLHRGRR